MNISFEAEAQAKINSVRDEDGSIDYVLLGFAHPKKCEALQVIGSGEGGVEALKAHCPDGDVAYGLVRSVLKLKAEGSAAVSSVKFVYIHWRPSVIPLSRKMKIGILDGKIKKGFGSYHASIEAETVDDLSDAIVTKYLEDIAGITDRTGNRLATVSATGQLTSASLLPKESTSTIATAIPGSIKNSNIRKTGTAADNLNVSSKGAPVNFQDEDELAATLEAVKSGVYDWALWKYADIKTLVKAGQGTGGLSALLDAAPNDRVCYGAFTVSDTLDVSTGKKGGISTKKFCFIVWTPDGVGAVQKAKIATHAGVVKSAFRKTYPYHYDYYVSNKDELSEKDVMAAIGKLTGTAELDSDAAKLHLQKQKELGEQRAAIAGQGKNLGGVTMMSAAQLDVDKEALLEHLAAIRKDDAPNDFAIAYFDNDSTKLLIGSTGSGSISGAVAATPSDCFSYLLLRLSERIDASTITRFLFVAITPQSVPSKLKGKFGSLFGRVKDLFSPFHATLNLDSATELTEELANLTIRGDRAKNSAS